jgi:hypothetical protein
MVFWRGIPSLGSVCHKKVTPRDVGGSWMSSTLLLVGFAVGMRYMYSVRSRYKMMKQKKKKESEESENN